MYTGVDLFHESATPALPPSRALVHRLCLWYTVREMNRIEHFVPGVIGESEGILSHLRWPIPAGVATAYATAYTDPDERVLVPYCQGSTMVREILATGRQVVALNFDPLIVLVVRTEMALPPARELGGAVARLGDSPK